MLNESELKTLLEVAEKATPGPFEVFPIKTVAGDTAGFTWGKYLSDNRDADHFWSSELVSFNDATYYSTFDPTTCAELVREVLRLREVEREQQALDVLTDRHLKFDLPEKQP